MSSSDDLHSERAIKLLDIVHDLHGADKRYPYENIPFSSNEDGAITLSPSLMAELKKDENQDLMSWAHDNIAKLFK
ncbi:MAG: hypothetical protein B7Y05_04240 [Polynucleobacter sp. 24-46-87]|jgi:hypothetical protein|uniref:hypothetical protein n=1 Tax=unclassified Polynucleobacter TaxID=2640945 RepID=UPI000BD31206|nr:MULTISPECIES: hypothetical protein [unclassified Polynucleobacter]OYY08787.1 MAG: hypothetical protein B7Y67_16480 [Polynucleobacter sp. 35-46-11]OZA15344.1 MAG: hypothetical protein B7Y05_04240 [Polynucleobacter sp. 24-46-87]OZA77693.1 MAG: hypothetical protein B7X71_03980 [Polynucleobacter sp. 39-46-10]